MIKRILAAGLMAAVALGALPAAAAADVVVPEGSEFRVRLDDTISSRSARKGDRFSVSLIEDVVLPDGSVLPAGLRGRGKVVDARGNGFLGRTGKLRIRLDYLKVGNDLIPLRGVKAKRGDHRTGTQVITALIFWPVTPLIRGESTKIRAGTVMSAYADIDVVLDGPVDVAARDEL